MLHRFVEFYMVLLNQILHTYKKKLPGEEPIRFFSLWGDRRVPYNAGNTAEFSDIAQEHFKVECPS